MSTEDKGVIPEKRASIPEERGGTPENKISSEENGEAPKDVILTDAIVIDVSSRPMNGNYCM